MASNREKVVYNILDEFYNDVLDNKYSNKEDIIKHYENKIRRWRYASKDVIKKIKITITDKEYAFMEKVLTLVTEEFKVNKEILVSKNRGAYSISDVRHIFCYLVFNNSKISTSKIGLFVNRINHTTVLNSLQMADILKDWEQYKDKIEKLDKIIKTWE